MNTNTTASSASATPAWATTTEDSRCAYRFPNGRRCRLPHSAAPSGFCFRHFHLRALVPQTPHDSTDLSTLLTAGLTEFKSATPINDFLSRLLLHQAEGRIPPRRAAVMAYTCNLLLRTLPALEHEAAPHPSDSEFDSEPPRIIIDMPRPDRD